MSTTIYQNLNASSSFESETTTATLKLKLAPPPPPTNFEDLFFHQTVPKQFKGDSFFNPSLTPKSLELCTECLGSETGCENSSLSNYDLEQSKQRKKSVKRFETKKKISSDFPPPLSTMGYLQMRRHSEEGRLVIEAVKAPVRRLKAERSDGRLRLSIFTPKIEEQEEEEELVNEEIDMEKFERMVMMSRCVNENEGLCRNWKPSLNWVATS